MRCIILRRHFVICAVRVQVLGATEVNYYLWNQLKNKVISKKDNRELWKVAEGDPKIATVVKCSSGRPIPFYSRTFLRPILRQVTWPWELFQPKLRIFSRIFENFFKCIENFFKCIENFFKMLNSIQNKLRNLIIL